MRTHIIIKILSTLYAKTYKFRYICNIFIKSIMKVNIDHIRVLYKKVVSIEEYFHPTNKWTHILPDGTNLQNPNVYYKELDIKFPPGGGEITFNEDIIERLVQKCIDTGATMIQFKCRDQNNEYAYPDYKINELLS